MDAPALLPHERPHLHEHRIHRVRLEQAALDVEDRVVSIGLVEPDDRLATRLREGELHLVPVPVDLRGPDDRGERDGFGGTETAEAREALGDLALLELELSLVAHVLEAAAATPPVVRTRGVGAERGRRLDPLDLGAGEARPHLGHPDVEPIPRHAAGDEHDVPARAGHALTPEGKVRHIDGQEIAATHVGHVVLHATSAGGRRQRG